MQKTIDFYTRILGFTVANVMNSDGQPNWCALERDDVVIMFATFEHYLSSQLTGNL